MIMDRVDLCIFDMDGLLLDTERYVWNIGEKKVGKELGIEITDEFITSQIGSSVESYTNKLKEVFGQDFPADLFFDKLMKYYENECINGYVPVMPGVFNLLDFLKENNIKMSVGTATIRSAAVSLLDKTEIYKYLDFAVFGDDVTKGKPDPETYLKSVEHFGFKPENCIVFEDSPNGAKAAYSGNINLVFVPNNAQPTELDKQKALTIIKKIDDIIPYIKKVNKI